MTRISAILATIATIAIVVGIAFAGSQLPSCEMSSDPAGRLHYHYTDSVEQCQ